MSDREGNNTSATDDCVAACLACYQSCRETAMHHCLETGGRFVAPEHFRLMHACAEICRTSADIMLSGAGVHVAVCDACAKVCAACAESCEAAGEMDDCVAACRRCAQECETMARSSHGGAGVHAAYR